MTVSNVTEAISDTISLDIFCAIAKGAAKSVVFKSTKDLTLKQFYSRINQLVRAGLVERIRGHYFLTSLEAIIYHSAIDVGFSNYGNLKAVDSIESSGHLGDYERLKLVKPILNEEPIQNVVKRVQ